MLWIYCHLRLQAKEVECTQAASSGLEKARSHRPPYLKNVDPSFKALMEGIVTWIIIMSSKIYYHKEEVLWHLTEMAFICREAWLLESVGSFRMSCSWGLMIHNSKPIPALWTIMHRHRSWKFKMALSNSKLTRIYYQLVKTDQARTYQEEDPLISKGQAWRQLAMEEGSMSPRTIGRISLSTHPYRLWQWPYSKNLPERQTTSPWQEAHLSHREAALCMNNSSLDP